MPISYPEADRAPKDKRAHLARPLRIGLVTGPGYLKAPVGALGRLLFVFVLSGVPLGCGVPAETSLSDSSPNRDFSVGEQLDRVRECRAHADCFDDEECTEDICGIDRVCRSMIVEGKACDDGDPCTQGALCLPEGGCGGPTVGPMPTPLCFSCVCEFETGMVCTRLEEGSSCDSSDPCVLNSACTAEGDCEGEDACVHGTCGSTAEGAFLCSCDAGWVGARCDLQAP